MKSFFNGCVYFFLVSVQVLVVLLFVGFVMEPTTRLLAVGVLIVGFMIAYFMYTFYKSNKKSNSNAEGTKKLG